MMSISFRASFSLLFLITSLLLGFSAYLQYAQGLLPCPLCYIQRYLLVGFAGACLTAALHNPAHRGRQFYALFSAAIAGLGLGVAGRQLWLQHLPEGAAPNCLPSMEFLLSHFPLKDALFAILKGDASCAKVDWTFLDFSIAHWTTLFFLGFVIHGGFWLWKCRATRH